MFRAFNVETNTVLVEFLVVQSILMRCLIVWRGEFSSGSYMQRLRPKWQKLLQTVHFTILIFTQRTQFTCIFAHTHIINLHWQWAFMRNIWTAIHSWLHYTNTLFANYTKERKRVRATNWIGCFVRQLIEYFGHPGMLWGGKCHNLTSYLSY